MPATKRTVAAAAKKFKLIAGKGDEEKNTACVMTALSWVKGESWTDHLPCVHPILNSRVIRVNDDKDTTEEQKRQILLAGQDAILDTWWIPGEVIAWSLSGERGEELTQFQKMMRTLARITDWKKKKEHPVLSSVNLRFTNLSSANLRFANLSFANLSSANLSFADLRSADLSSADLSSADLRSANLSFANLRSANLSSADLSFTNLSSADLSSATLSSADLRSANLSSADLRSANLSSADLRFADLRSADLSFANLSFADLSSADLRFADLRFANLRSARNVNLPPGWKITDSGIVVKE